MDALLGAIGGGLVGGFISTKMNSGTSGAIFGGLTAVPQAGIYGAAGALAVMMFAGGAQLTQETLMNAAIGGAVGAGYAFTTTVL